jgi:hypothetical protein
VRRWSLVLLLLVCLQACDGDEPEARDARPTTPSLASAAPVPEARTEVGAARLGLNGIVVLGGFRADGSASDRVDVYDLPSATWRDGPKLPLALHHAGAAAFGGRVYVAGGFTDAGSESAAVWSLGPDADDVWREEPPLGTARGALGLAATTDRLVAFGGVGGGQVLATAEVLIAGAAGWRQLPSMAQPREHTAAAARSGRVYAIAGRVASLESNLVSVESIDPSAFAPEWRKEPDLQFSRGGTAAASLNAGVCVAGGEEPGGTIPAVECLIDGAWRTVASLAEPRHGLGVVAGDGFNLHVLAGGPQPGLFVSTAHEVLTVGP